LLVKVESLETSRFSVYLSNFRAKIGLPLLILGLEIGQRKSRLFEIPSDSEMTTAQRIDD